MLVGIHDALFKSWTKFFPSMQLFSLLLLLLIFGCNDSMSPHPTGQGPHVPLAEYIQNMKKIAIHLRSLSPKTRLLFLSAPPVNEAQICEVFGRTNELCRKYSEACIELCQELGVKVVDLWTAIQQRSDWLDVCFTDGIHFSSEASKIVVKEILKVLKEAEWEPCLHWRSLPAEFSEDSPFDVIGFDGKTKNVSDLNLHWQTAWD